MQHYQHLQEVSANEKWQAACEAAQKRREIERERRFIEDASARGKMQAACAAAEKRRQIEEASARGKMEAAHAAARQRREVERQIRADHEETLRKFKETAQRRQGW